MSKPIAVKLTCCNNINSAIITLIPNATTVLRGMDRVMHNDGVEAEQVNF